MSLQHCALASVYYPRKLVKSVGRRLGLATSDHLRVLTYHDIPPFDKARFAKQLRWLARDWNFVSPEHFADAISGGEPLRGRNLLLTFDDGFASNREVAEEILNPLGISAVFFVVPDLVGVKNRDEARDFIAHHIELGTDTDLLPSHLHNMGWTDLETLLEQGHKIGNHSRTHARLAQIGAREDLEVEIVGSAKTLSQRLGTPIEHFAYPFGNLDSFSEAALSVARQLFRFIHSGLRGNNAGGVSPLAIRRDAIQAKDPIPLVGSFVEGTADFRYAKARARLDEWAIG